MVRAAADGESRRKDDVSLDNGLLELVFEPSRGGGLKSLKLSDVRIEQAVAESRIEETVCANVLDGTIDGVIIPQTGWFDSPEHREHVAWLKAYFDEIDAED